MLPTTDESISALRLGDVNVTAFTGLRVLADGTRLFYRDGKFHRDDGPAVAYLDGSVFYFCRGLLHREGGPAVQRANGYCSYWYMGQRHREDGPARTWKNGSREYFLHGQRHREDGPAVRGGSWTAEYWLEYRTYPRTDWLWRLLGPRFVAPCEIEAFRAVAPTWEGTPNALFETLCLLVHGCSAGELGVTSSAR